MRLGYNTAFTLDFGKIFRRSLRFNAPIILRDDDMSQSGSQPPLNHQSQRRSPHTPTTGNTEYAHRFVKRDLPCVGCGYDLKGISPEGACPECGLGVSRTLRYVVDPAASEIVPLRRGYWLALILVLVPAILLVATVILWLPHIEYAVASYRGIVQPIFDQRWTLWKGVAGFLGIIAGILTFGLQNPTGQRIRRSYQSGLWIARLGLMFWGCIIIIMAVYDGTHGTWRSSMYDHEKIDLSRSVLRIFSHLALVPVVIGFSPVFRFLALRSLYHRMAQISRQGFLAMGVALAVAIAGDALWIITGSIQINAMQAGSAIPLTVDRLALFSSMLVLVGSGMLSLALLNSMMDALRLALKINSPRYSIDEIVEG